MKVKLFALTCVLLCLLLCAGAVSVGAQSQSDAATQAQAVVDGILAFAQNTSTLQEWIDTTLAETAGTGAEWYVLCLSQSGEYDFSAYESALLAYLSQNNVPSATTKQKYALCLAAIGSTDAYIARTAEQTIGSLGIMSYVYGLHLANNGYATSLAAEQIVDQILSLQKSDGGWAISGTGSDVDVTAMTLQALAAYDGINPEVTSAIDAALILLSDRQQEDGGFISYGVSNPESAAQVIIALCSLGTDPFTDARFIKNGNTAFDAIAQFSMGNGSYSHTQGGSYSSAATAQVLCAATAYLRFAQNKSPLYTLDHAVPDQVQTVPDESESESSDNAPSATDDLAYKPIACAVIVLLGVAACVILLVLKKRHYKNFVAIGLAVALLIALVLLVDIRLPEDYYHGQSETKQNPIGTVTLTIRCDRVGGLDQIDHLPDDGMILTTEIFEIEAGETVYDILTQAARQHGLHVDASGVGEAAYVRGISYLYEQEHGDLSGWTYLVNGISPSVGCGAYVLSDGDEIVFEYTLTLGSN